MIKVPLEDTILAVWPVRPYYIVMIVSASLTSYCRRLCQNHIVDFFEFLRMPYRGTVFEFWGHFGVVFGPTSTTSWSIAARREIF